MLSNSYSLMYILKYSVTTACNCTNFEWKEETSNKKDTKTNRTSASFQFHSTIFTGNKMHIADILSRLAGKDLEPSDQLIPISFNVHTRSSRPLKLYYANKHKTSIPYTTKMTTPKITHTKLPVQSVKVPHPPKVPTQLSKSSTSGKMPASTYWYFEESISTKTSTTTKRGKKIFG